MLSAPEDRSIPVAHTLAANMPISEATNVGKLTQRILQLPAVPPVESHTATKTCINNISVKMVNILGKSLCVSL